MLQILSHTFECRDAVTTQICLGFSCIVAMLEWKACRKKAGLALEVEFSDEQKGQGHVESWTTAEKFAASLLAER